MIPRVSLYTFVDAAYLHGRPPKTVAQALCDGGSDLIQLRAKDLPASQVRKMAEEIQPITRAAGVALVINDYPDIAVDVGAEYCHLGQEDFFGSGKTHIRELPASTKGVHFGLSTHAPDQAQRAITAGPNYIAIGPVFPTGTKPTARPVTLEYVRWAASHVQMPWFAIGGITLDNLGEVVAAGARRICVVSAILNSYDIAQACQTFKKRLVSAVESS